MSTFVSAVSRRLRSTNVLLALASGWLDVVVRGRRRHLKAARQTNQRRHL